MRSWIQRKLVHGEGDVLGEPVSLATVWHRVLERIFQYDPASGQLLHDRVLVIMGKGNVKTETVAQLGLAEIDGPLAPISPNVPISAASWDNANRLFGAARLSILGDGGAKRSPLAERFREGVHILEDRILLPDREGRLYRTAAVAGTNDGGLPTCYLGDELHEWETERARRMWTVQGKSLRKRRVPRPLHPLLAEALGIAPNWSPGRNQPLVAALFGAMQIAISTPGVDHDSLLGELYEHGVQVANGEVTDPGFLFMCWEADEKLDLEDPAERRQAILQANPTVGEALRFENVEASFHDPTVPRSEFVRYNLARWPDAETRWMASAVWDATTGEVLLDPALPVYAAVTMAHDHRSAAVALAQRQGEGVALRVAHFPETPLPASDFLDVAVVESHLEQLRRSFPARVLAPRRLKPGGPERILPIAGPEMIYTGSFFEGSAQRLRAAGAAMVDIPNSVERLAPAAESLLSLAVAGKLVHDRDPQLADQVGDVVARQAATGWHIAAKAGKSISSALAAMVAVHRAVTAPRLNASSKSHVGVGF